jgi:hypothetical protein
MGVGKVTCRSMRPATPMTGRPSRSRRDRPQALEPYRVSVAEHEVEELK